MSHYLYETHFKYIIILGIIKKSKYTIINQTLIWNIDYLIHKIDIYSFDNALMFKLGKQIILCSTKQL